MRVVRLLTICALTFALISCGEDDSTSPGSSSNGDTTNEADTSANEADTSSPSGAVSNGNAINQVSAALASIADVDEYDPGKADFLGTAECGDHGEPVDAAGDDMTTSNAAWAGQMAYCKATLNSGDPETPRGALWIAGAMACVAGQEELFDGLSAGSSNTETVDVELTTECFLSQPLIDKTGQELGTTTLSGVAITVTDTADSTAYDFGLTFEIPGQTTESIYLKNSDGIIAALSTGDTPWAFKFDTATGDFWFEIIDLRNTRRIRMKIVGHLDSDYAYSSIDTIDGFIWSGGDEAEGSMGTWSTAAVFTGNHEDGYLGDSYTSAGIDQDDGCFTTGGATCAGLTLDNVSVETSFDIQDETEGYTAGLNLAAYTDSLIEFATVDVTDPDVTQ